MDTKIMEEHAVSIFRVEVTYWSLNIHHTEKLQYMHNHIKIHIFNQTPNFLMMCNSSGNVIMNNLDFMIKRS